MYHTDWNGAAGWWDFTTVIQCLQLTRTIILATIFQAAEGSPDGKKSGHVHGLPEGKSQQKPKTWLGKQEAKARACSIYWSFHCCTCFNLAFSLGRSKHPGCLPALLYAYKKGTTPTLASWVTYPAVIATEKEKSRENGNTQNQLGGCQNHTL